MSIFSGGKRIDGGIFQFAGSGSGPPTPTAIPAMANLVARWSPDDNVNGYANNASMGTYTDSTTNAIALSQATGANQPVYKTGGMNGKAYVQMAAAKVISVTTNAVLNTAMSDGSYTIMLFYRNVTASAFSVAVSCGSGPLNVFAGATSYTPAGTTTNSAGVAGGVAQASYRIPHDASAASSNMQSVGFVCGYTANGAIGNFSQVILNGMSQLCGGGVSAQNGTFSIGISGSNSIVGELYDVLVWDRPLSPVETAQIHKWACEKYNQIPPWTSYGKMYVGLGSSQGAGTGSTNPGYDNYITKSARDTSIPIGAYAVLGYSSQSAGTLGGMAVDGLYGLPALLGVPCNLSWLEYYNTRLDADPSIAVLSAISGIKAAGFNKIGLLTLTDSNPTPSSRATYLTGVITNYAVNGINNLIRLDLDGVPAVSGVGQVGTAFTGSTYFAADLIHNTTLGYTTIAGYLQPVLATW